MFEEHKTTHDPGLTSEGITQCLELREHLKIYLNRRNVNRIIVSPMRRAMETALHAMDWLIKDEGVPIEASALWQVEEIKVDKSFHCIDFSKIDPTWPDKTSPEPELYHYSRQSILQWGQKAVEDLYDRDEGLLIVVSHNGFLRTGVIGRWTANADYRLYSLERDESGVRCKLIEEEGMEAAWSFVVWQPALSGQESDHQLGMVRASSLDILFPHV
ncbi:hypothetical protein B0T21DRAFT_352643 [Apiosordaria backusii]|uniref:Phosphoglycerate mutase n=1 Tax=Apiosordaria backusii TaxID=314023 RepID=A0AA40A781_9PEZI|nr:hypothetical protein B0T21DRAFT_352643 [Apiosordaria backusii]